MDQNRCKATVYPNERWGSFHGHQCHKKVWKDGHCKVHHPETVKKRQDAAQENYRKKWANSPEMRLISALETVEKYQKVLEQISKEADCLGPGCPYCEREDMQHPYTAVAKLAQEALKK